MPAGALVEYERHGARGLLANLEREGLVVVVGLEVAEVDAAVSIARALTERSPGRADPAQHMGRPRPSRCSNPVGFRLTPC